MPRSSIPENPSYATESKRSERHVAASNNTSHRWRLNGTGHLVDAGAASDWELAQDIARLKLGSVAELAEDIRGPIKTPPQSKLAAAAVVQFNDASPLETSSDASIDSSPHGSDHQLSPSHSRVSSTDTLDSQESALSSASHTQRGPTQLKIAAGGEAKERPHSFSGGLSAAELRRLKHAGEEPSGTIQPGDTGLPPHQWSSSHYRDLLGASDKSFSPDQPTYPSLASGTFGRGQQQYGYRAVPGSLAADVETDYVAGPRTFFPPAQGIPGNPQHFVQGRPVDGIPPTNYRQPQRGFPPQSLLPNHTGLGYAAGHVPHLSLGTAQQLYDMVQPHADGNHPAVTRVQQQHNMFRATHQHSASDPSALRDATALALLGNQGFAPPNHNLYPQAVAPTPMGLYPNQFYGPEIAAAVNQLQAQFTGPYGVIPNQTIGITNTGGSSTGSQNGGGPSANNRKLGLYKTELCRSWEEKGSCRYGAKCQFAHGEEELRTVSRHPKVIFPSHECLQTLTNYSCSTKPKFVGCVESMMILMCAHVPCRRFGFLVPVRTASDAVSYTPSSLSQVSHLGLMGPLLRPQALPAASDQTVTLTIPRFRCCNAYRGRTKPRLWKSRLQMVDFSMADHPQDLFV